MTTETSTAIMRATELLQHGRADEARALLERALDGGANGSADDTGANTGARRLLVQCLVQAGDLNAAIDRQKALVPPDIAATDAQGRADALAAARLAQMAMYYTDAADIACALVARDPQDVEAASLLATLVLWTDGPEAAREALSGVLSFDELPPHLLSETLAFYDDPPAALTERALTLAEDTKLPAQARADLLLAMAQQHDRAGEFDEAWTLAERGNALAPARPAQDWRAVLAAHRAIFTGTRPVTSQNSSPRHLYLLGTPRSGQSLLQSVLAAAPGVASLGERGALLQHVLYRTSDIARQGQGEREAYYGELAASDRRGILRLAGEPELPDLVVDKSPLHLAVAGSIARIHPGAAFAAVLRDPADTAMSIWLRSFPPVYDYAGDLGAILDHLDFALDAVAAWQEAGLAIRLIDHAALVASPAQESKALFEWLKLEWNDKYLKPENRTQPVPTFSAAQVRQPISTKMVRGASPYAEKLSEHSDRIEILRAKTHALLAANG